MKTYSELIVLINYLNATTSESGSKKELKLKKIVEKIKPLFDEYNEKRDDIRLEHAYADSNGILDLNEKGEYKYTKEGVKGMNNDFKSLLIQTFNFELLEIGTDGIEDLFFLSGWVKGM